MTSIDGMKQLAQDFGQRISNHDLDGAMAMVDDQLVDHVMPEGTPPGKTGIRQYYQMFINAFPDFRLTLDAISAENDMVVLHAQYAGTSQGQFYNVPATGKPFTTNVVEVYRVRNDKFVERFVWYDIMKIMREIAG
jgi:steroid delta-isomerase-like uncharacterized protein